MFWNIFIELCEKNNIKPNPLAEKIGVSSGVITKWKNGSIPNVEALLKISDYFNVSIDYLLGRSKLQDSSDPIDNTEVWSTYTQLSTKDKLEVQLEILNRGKK